MPNLKQALQIVVNAAVKKTKHKHYDHVLKLKRDYYRPLMTGEGAEHLISRFNLREDEDAYKQRLRLTQLITPSITNTLLAPARKVPKVRPVVDSAYWKQDSKSSVEEIERRQRELDQAVQDFYAGKSVDHFMGSVLIDQGALDPNAFCLVLFGDFDARWEKPRSYASIIGCEDAWDFRYLNGQLEWLLVHRDYEYEADAKRRKRQQMTVEERVRNKMQGHAWWLYAENHQVMMLQVDKSIVPAGPEKVIIDNDGKPVDASGPVALEARGTYWLRVSGAEAYEVVIYEHKSGAVQAFRIGYIPDHRTKGETMVNIWHPALPYLLKGVKAGSELDLSASLHAFLQKISYEHPCPGHWEADSAGNKVRIDCDGGYTPSGDICKRCGGSGLMVHRSGQDHIGLALPKNKEDAFDLSSLTHYVQLPVEVLEWQDKYVDKLERACYRAVYNSDRFRPADSASTTATGDIIDLQSIYDTLKPLADWYSQSRVLIYRLVASAIVGSAKLANLVVTHEFPRNMRFETTAERVKLLQDMRNAGASNGALMQVDTAILEDLYVDDPEALKKAKTIAYFNPFVGKSADHVMGLISQDLATKEDKILWANENRVYNECEARFSGKEIGFYDLSRAKQRAVIDEVIAEIMEQMDAQAEEVAKRETLGLEPDDDEDGEGQGGGDGLPPSPGESATGRAQ